MKLVSLERRWHRALLAADAAPTFQELHAQLCGFTLLNGHAPNGTSDHAPLWLEP